MLAWKTRRTRQRWPSWAKVKSTVIWAAPSAISALARRSSQVQLPYRAEGDRFEDGGLARAGVAQDGDERLAGEVQRPDAARGSCGCRRRLAAAVSCLLLPSRCPSRRPLRRGCSIRPLPGPSVGPLERGPQQALLAGRCPGTSLAASASRSAKVARMSPATAPAGTWPARYSRNRSGRSGSSPSAAARSRMATWDAAQRGSTVTNVACGAASLAAAASSGSAGR